MEETLKTVLVVAICGLLLASCSPPPPDVAKIRKEVEDLVQNSARDMVTGKMDSTLSQYADDPVSMPNNGPMLKGKPAIKAYFSQMMNGLKFKSVTFTTTDVFVGGPYIYEIGTYAMTMTMGTMPEMSDKGKYLTVYERGKDGKLKIKAETWNTDTMPPMPEKAGM
jgi:ketosteroid isomerase-like protein